MTSRLDYDKFKIEDSFGGDQAWLKNFFSKEYLSKKACGLVAFSQSLYYLSKTRKDYSLIYPYSEFDKRTFTSFMLQISTWLKPSIIGIPSLFFLKRGVRTYLKRINSDLKSQELKNFKDRKKAEDFIEEALDKNCPVIFIGWFNKNPLFNFHWTTITAIIKDDNKCQLEISSWGNKYKLDIEELLNTRGYKALIYFY